MVETLRLLVETAETPHFGRVKQSNPFTWKSRKLPKKHPRLDLLGEEADDALCAHDHFLQVAVKRETE